MGIGAAIGGIVGGIAQGSAAKKAAAAQTDAANRQIDYQKEIYADQTKRFSPYLDSGTNALAAYNYEMGLGGLPTFGGSAPQIETIAGTPAGIGRPGAPSGGGDHGWNRGILGGNGHQGAGAGGTPTRYRVNGQMFNTMEEAQAYANANRTGGTAYGGFKATPGYDFRKQQGIDAIDASAAARGGLMSGKTLQDLTTFGDGIASQEYGNYMQRLGGMTDMGMSAAGMQATAGNNAAAGVSNALGNIGNAQAAGAIGQGNALAGMFNNLSGAFGYMNRPGGGGGITIGKPGSLFSGGGNGSW